MKKFDSWFCFPSVIAEVQKLGYTVISMAKKTSKIHYLYNEEHLPVTEIYRRNAKRRGRSHYLLSVEISIPGENKNIPARLVYVRNRNKRMPLAFL